ncbi:hypothetical protein GCM10010260_45410 [Streptomyces filipinensis]|uniref:Uncharacterized protein n=1 Tax=Streptomyces filipinensis TaxID=66887 RepID=A0A918MCU6_9ACTN|nr:hypothetical protein GCM10010260_45410 [Streptomyces filipinensis]
MDVVGLAQNGDTLTGLDLQLADDGHLPDPPTPGAAPHTGEADRSVRAGDRDRHDPGAGTLTERRLSLVVEGA